MVEADVALYLGAYSAFAVLDAITLRTIAALPVAQLSYIGTIVASPDGKFVYYTVNFISGKKQPGIVVAPPGEIVVVDTSTYKPVAAIQFSEGLGDVAVTPDGSTLVCTSNFGRAILVDTATNKKTGSVQFSHTYGYLSAVAISPDGATAYLVDNVYDTTYVADLATKMQDHNGLTGDALEGAVHRGGRLMIRAGITDCIGQGAVRDRCGDC